MDLEDKLDGKMNSLCVLLFGGQSGFQEKTEVVFKHGY